MSFIGGSGKPSDYAETTVMPYYATYQEKETSIPSRRWMSVDTPAGPTTYNAGNVIRINLPGTAYLDPKNSFIKYTMKVTNGNSANGVNGKGYRVNEDLLRSYHWAAHKHFRRARLLSSSGVVLEDLDLYNVHESINRKFKGASDQEKTIQDCLSHTDMDDAGLVPSSTGYSANSSDYNQHLQDFMLATGFASNGTSPTAALCDATGTPGAGFIYIERDQQIQSFGANPVADLPASDSNIQGLDYTYQLGFGLFRSGKLLPMQYMGGLVVELTVEDDALLVRQDSFRVGPVATGSNAWASSKIQLSNIEFHSSLLRFDEKYDLGIAEALQQTGLRIPFNSYSVIRNVMKPQGQYTLTVSERASSVQCVYACFRPVSAVNNTQRRMDAIEFWPRLDITDYQLHTATQNYPDNPVRLLNSATEAFAETIKCFQGIDRPWERTLSSSNAGCHELINATSYGVIDPRTKTTSQSYNATYTTDGGTVPLFNIKYPYARYAGTVTTGPLLARSAAGVAEASGIYQSAGQGFQFVFGVNTSVHPDVSSGVNTAAMAMNMDLKINFGTSKYLLNTNITGTDGQAAGGVANRDDDFEIDVFVETERTLEILCGGSPRVIL